jgi:hypothetical protein
MKAFNGQMENRKTIDAMSRYVFEVAAVARVMEGYQALLDGVRNSEETGKVFQFCMHGV